MGLYKAIKERVKPDEERSGLLEDAIRNMADANGEIENLLVEYGIKCFCKKWRKKKLDSISVVIDADMVTKGIKKAKRIRKTFSSKIGD